MGWFKRNRTVSHAPGTVNLQQVCFVVELILSLWQYRGCVPLLSLFHMLLLFTLTDSRQNSKDDSEELSVTSPPSDDKTPKSTASSDSSEDEQGGTISELKKNMKLALLSDTCVCLSWCGFFLCRTFAQVETCLM